MGSEHTNSNSSAVSSQSIGVAEANSKHNRIRRLDMRSYLVALLGVVLGSLAWTIPSIVCGTPVFRPSWVGLTAWFFFAGLFVACIDPRSPWIIWPSVYFGAYVLTWPIFPRDPLIYLGMIFGVVVTAASLFGALIPFVVATVAVNPTSRWRRWAGYVD